MTAINHIEHQPHPVLSRRKRRARVLASNDINIVLDVGGWVGAYGRELRNAGYRGRIVSFEPLAVSFTRLKEVAESDSDGWDARRVALGSHNGTGTLNVAREASCTTMLPMEPRHLQATPEAQIIATEAVRLVRLDHLWPELVPARSRVFLKVDVQGFELEVLDGLGDYLSEVSAVELELSLVPLYRGGPVWTDVADCLAGRGFRLSSLEALLDDPSTGEMLQADGIFLRR